MRTHCVYVMLLLAAGMLGGCSKEKNDTSGKEGVETVLPAQANEVTVMVLKKTAFNHELVSNGTIKAGKMADLRFETSGTVADIYVKNGDFVVKGQKLAELDKFRLSNNTARMLDAFEKSKLDLQDVLIGQGYAVGDTARIPAETMKLARIKSGYDQSKAQYELARYEEEHATLRAPFDGVVANLFLKQYNNIGVADVFCTVIGRKGMETDFTVLENELPLIKKGDKVVVIPYADPTKEYEGKIWEINPLVNEKGMVRVKAVMADSDGLFDGMNVRVSIHRELKGQFVIPKTAVVLRSGKQVVFTLKNGTAIWNYVNTILENHDSYTLAASEVKEGDTVIVTGNVNLAHEAEVIVKRKPE